MNKKIVALIIVLLLVVGGLFAYYYEEITEFLLQGNAGEYYSEGIDPATLKARSETVTFEVPNGSHTVTFTVYLDEEGYIWGVKADDTEQDVEYQSRLHQFASQALPKVEGKLLSEIEDIDIVGTSSITTEGFNEALENIKAQD